MHRIAIIVGCLTILGACGSPTPTTQAEPTEPSRSAGAPSSVVAAGTTPTGGSTPPGASPACQAMDSFIYDLLIVAKAREEPPAKKQEILASTTNHASALRVAAPEVGLAVEARLDYASQLLAGEPTPEAKNRELTAKAQFDDWYATHGCG